MGQVEARGLERQLVIHLGGRSVSFHLSQEAQWQEARSGSRHLDIGHKCVPCGGLVQESQAALPNAQPDSGAF